MYEELPLSSSSVAAVGSVGAGFAGGVGVRPGGFVVGAGAVRGAGCVSGSGGSPIARAYCTASARAGSAYPVIAIDATTATTLRKSLFLVFIVPPARRDLRPGPPLAMVQTHDPWPALDSLDIEREATRIIV